MKKIFTRNRCTALAIILLMGMALSANAQYAVKIIDANAWSSAVAKDASGNIYELKAIQLAK